MSECVKHRYGCNAKCVVCILRMCNDMLILGVCIMHATALSAAFYRAADSSRSRLLLWIVGNGHRQEFHLPSFEVDGHLENPSWCQGRKGEVQEDISSERQGRSCLLCGKTQLMLPKSYVLRILRGLCRQTYVTFQ